MTNRPFFFFSIFFISFFHSFAQNESPIIPIDVFPPQSQHTHGSTLVELPNGDILAAWFQGSGERQADDVAIMGARLLKGRKNWTPPFVLADVPDFPDINPVLFIDPQNRLWLMWYTVLANQWESSILKYRLSEDYQQAQGPPVWNWQEVLHVKPGGKTERGIQETDPFVGSLVRQLKEYDQYLPQTLEAFPSDQRAAMNKRWEARKKELISQAKGEDLVRRGRITKENGESVEAQLGYPQFRRLGWQTRNKPLFLPSGRMIVPLYADGFDFSLMAITDNGGKNWHFSEPLVSIGGVQPALVLRDDGAIVAYMRDNGPPPQRLMTSYSKDNGQSWSLVTDSDVLNPGSAADVVELADGRWLLVHNDTEDGRHSLALSLSADEGANWKIIRRLEKDMREGTDMRAHYPAIIQGRDGKVHITYTYQNQNARGERVKTIRYICIDDF